MSANKQALRDKIQLKREILDTQTVIDVDELEALLDELEARTASETLYKASLKQADAELEGREVTLPAQKYCPGEYAGSVLWGDTEVWNQAISECAKAIRAAGITVKGE